MEMIDVYSKIYYVKKLKVNIVDFLNDFGKKIDLILFSFPGEALGQTAE